MVGEAGGQKTSARRRTSRGGIRTSDTYVPAKKPEPAPDKRRTTLTLPAPPKERIVGEFYRLPDDDYYHRPPKPKPAGRGQHGYKRGRPKKQKREQRIREDFGWTPEPYDLDSIRLGEALPDHGARPDYLGSQERHLHARAKEDDPGPTERERQRWRLTDMLAALAKDHAPGKSWWRDDDVARWFATDAVPDARTLISMFGLSPAKEAKALAGFERVFWGQIDYQRWLRRKKTGKMTKV